MMLMPGPKTILIVEDEPLIAMMLEDFLESLGHSIHATCETVADALAQASKGGFDLAILDVNLGGQTAWPIAHMLREQGHSLRHRHRRPCRTAAGRVRRGSGDRETLYHRPGDPSTRRCTAGGLAAAQRLLSRRAGQNPIEGGGGA